MTLHISKSKSTHTPLLAWILCLFILIFFSYSSCPTKVRSQSPRKTDHSFTVLSLEPLSTFVPLGEYFTHETSLNETFKKWFKSGLNSYFEWPVKVTTHLPLLMSQCLMVLSVEPLITVSPFGEKSTEFTGLKTKNRKLNESANEWVCLTVSVPWVSWDSFHSHGPTIWVCCQMSHWALVNCRETKPLIRSN